MLLPCYQPLSHVRVLFPFRFYIFQVPLTACEDSQHLLVVLFSFLGRDSLCTTTAYIQHILGIPYTPDRFRFFILPSFLVSLLDLLELRLLVGVTVSLHPISRHQDLYQNIHHLHSLCGALESFRRKEPGTGTSSYYIRSTEYSESGKERGRKRRLRLVLRTWSLNKKKSKPKSTPSKTVLRIRESARPGPTTHQNSDH